MDEHRDWGWCVVNYVKYRAIRSEDDRREQNRLAQERWRNKNKPASAEGKQDKPIQKQKQIQKQIQETHPPTPRTRGSAGDDGFDAFWLAYPNKTAKQAAAKAFAKLAPSADLLDEILQAVARQKTWPKWAKDGGQYIPNPATWLNGGEWANQPPAVVAVQHETPRQAAIIDRTIAFSGGLMNVRQTQHKDFIDANEIFPALG
jgi:hypothetical protein